MIPVQRLAKINEVKCTSLEVACSSEKLYCVTWLKKRLNSKHNKQSHHNKLSAAHKKDERSHINKQAVHKPGQNG